MTKLTIDASDDRLEDGLVAARAMLAALKNTRAYLAKHADKLPPMSLNGMDRAIAQAEAAGIKAEG
jgi:hypothetical protein